MNDNWKIKTPDNVYYEVDARMTTLINNMGKIIYARKESIDADRRDLENLFSLVKDEFAKSEVPLDKQSGKAFRYTGVMGLGQTARDTCQQCDAPITDGGAWGLCPECEAVWELLGLADES